MKQNAILSIFFFLTLTCYAQDFPVMKNVPGGNFVTENWNETGEHVNVPVKAFLMSESEITAGQWREFVQEAHYSFLWGRYTILADPTGVTLDTIEDNYPIYGIRWIDAIYYCNWLSREYNLEPVYTIIGNGEYPEVTWNPEKNGYRLPTEVEWEYAARGAKNEQYNYAGSNDIKTVGWHAYFSGNHPHPVKSLTPNSLGIYDMTGNVSEWCWDQFSINYLPTSGENLGPEHSYAPNWFPSDEMEEHSRAIRGGDWASFIKWSSVSGRAGAYINNRTTIGFRVVRNTE